MNTYIDHSKTLKAVRNVREIARSNNLDVTVTPNSVIFNNTADYETTFTNKFLSIPDFLNKFK